jgi:hypothetical protein
MGHVGRALALICALACALQKPTPAPAAPGDQPAPRQAVAGIRSIDSRSTVVYAALPDAPHRLQSTYMFPDRARWWLGVGAEPAVRRQMRFQSGSSVWALDPEAQQSRALEGAERSTTLVQLEMRRALFLWPEGFGWKRKDTRAETSLPGIGTLTATFADARALNPTSFAFTDLEGKAGDEYRAITWRDGSTAGKADKPDPSDKQDKDKADKDKSVKKAWPTHLELWHAQALVWTETIEALDTNTRFIDSFFVPPDTRSGTVGRPVEVGAVRPLDLPETRAQRIALDAGTTWPKACAEQARVAAERNAALKSLDVKLEAFATFEVSDDLQPTAILLRLGGVREPVDPALAKDWPLTPERPGLSTFVMGVPALERSRLEGLRRAVPSDAVSGTPYVRFDPAHPDQHVMVLLPLAPKTDVPTKDPGRKEH